MGCAGKADPSHAAELDLKFGRKSQIPRNVMTVHIQLSAAGILIDCVVCNLKVEWALTLRTQAKLRYRKSLNETPRFSCSWKPSCPDLNRMSYRMPGTTTQTGIQQQVAKPPGAAAVSEAQAQKPDFIAASRRQGGENFVEGIHEWRGTAATVVALVGIVGLAIATGSRAGGPVGNGTGT